MSQDQVVAANLAKRLRQAFLVKADNEETRAYDGEDRPPSFADMLLSDPFEGEQVSTLDLLPREWGVIVDALERYAAQGESAMRKVGR